MKPVSSGFVSESQAPALNRVWGSTVLTKDREETRSIDEPLPARAAAEDGRETEPQPGVKDCQSTTAQRRATHLAGLYVVLGIPQ